MRILLRLFLCVTTLLTYLNQSRGFCRSDSLIDILGSCYIPSSSVKVGLTDAVDYDLPSEQEMQKHVQTN